MRFSSNTQEGSEILCGICLLQTETVADAATRVRRGVFVVIVREIFVWFLREIVKAIVVILATLGILGILAIAVVGTGMARLFRTITETVLHALRYAVTVQTAQAKAKALQTEMATRIMQVNTVWGAIETVAVAAQTKQEKTAAKAVVFVLYLIKQKRKNFKCVHNRNMETMRKIYRFFKGRYDVLSRKKYTTIAGTLVFFLIMSFMPLAFWLTLLIGRLPIDLERFFDLPVFESVQEIFLYVQSEAKSATTGVSIFLLATTLYSSTNLFYQMRKSGEIIYDFRRKKQGLRLRLGALGLMGIVLGLIVLFLLLLALVAFLFSGLFSAEWMQLLDYALLLGLAFLLVLLLNVYICPYKEKISRFFLGTCITIVAWIGAVIGFSVYMKISNVGRLYGALSSLIVFFLWLYVLMICFIAGVIFNSERITKRKQQERKRKREERTLLKKE